MGQVHFFKVGSNYPENKRGNYPNATIKLLVNNNMKEIVIKKRCKCGRKLIIKYYPGDITSKTCECGLIYYVSYINKRI